MRVSQRLDSVRIIILIHLFTSAYETSWKIFDCEYIHLTCVRYFSVLNFCHVGVKADRYAIKFRTFSATIILTRHLDRAK